jgi:hypothetical protein
VTAEIAVMNRSAVALAADSAVTMQSQDEQKVWQSANKIFGLSRQHSVGFMIYGSADIMRVPLETVVKIYRDQLRDAPFDHLSDYTADFVAFMEGERRLFPADEQELYFISAVFAFYGRIRENVETSIEREIQESGSISESGVREAVTAHVNVAYDVVGGLDALDAMPPAFATQLTRKHKQLIDGTKQHVFQALPLTSASSRKLTRLAGILFTKDYFPLGYAGIVIAGFGAEDTFPTLTAFGCDGIANNVLKRETEDPVEVSRDIRAAIRPYAQHEMAYSFLEGVEPDYQGLVEQGVEELLSQHLELVLDAIPRASETTRQRIRETVQAPTAERVDQLRAALAEIRRQYWWLPIVQVVSVLPKDELASMAESLVNLTALKRKVSLSAETVGGPIDVAIISKGEGFVWAKRKRYFSLEDNPHFLARYFG